MIGRSHSPISSLDGQDQALKIPVGVATLVSDVPRGGGKHCGLHPHRPWGPFLEAPGNYRAR